MRIDNDNLSTAQSVATGTDTGVYSTKAFATKGRKMLGVGKTVYVCGEVTTTLEGSAKPLGVYLCSDVVNADDITTSGSPTELIKIGTIPADAADGDVIGPFPIPQVAVAAGEKAGFLKYLADDTSDPFTAGAISTWLEIQPAQVPSMPRGDMAGAS